MSDHASQPSQWLRKNRPCVPVHNDTRCGPRMMHNQTLMPCSMITRCASDEFKRRHGCNWPVCVLANWLIFFGCCCLTTSTGRCTTSDNNTNLLIGAMVICKADNAKPTDASVAWKCQPQRATLPSEIPKNEIRCLRHGWRQLVNMRLISKS